MKFYFNKQHIFSETAYPERLQKADLVRNSVFIFLIIFSFLMAFKPFIVSEAEQKVHYVFICLIHAVVPAVTFWIYYRIFDGIRSRDQQFQWNLFKEYSHLIAVLFLIGLENFLLRDAIYNNPDNWSQHYLIEEIRNTLVAGIFFYFFLRLVSFYMESKKGVPMVFQFVPLAPLQNEAAHDKVLFISTQVKQDDFYLDTEHLLFVKADGNYIELTQLDGDKTTTEIKRISLSQFASLLSEHTQFFRCHRTYLVNMFKITRVDGNSQGYHLTFGDNDAKIPVSRKQKEDFDILYQKFSNGLATQLAAHHKV